MVGVSSHPWQIGSVVGPASGGLVYAGTAWRAPALRRLRRIEERRVLDVAPMLGVDIVRVDVPAPARDIAS